MPKRISPSPIPLPVTPASRKNSTSDKTSPIPTLLQRVQTNPSQLSTHEILQLQRTLGNQAVAHLLETISVPDTTTLPPSIPSNPGQPPIQRTIETAAAELQLDGNVKKLITLKQLEKIAGKHGIASPNTDLPNVQQALHKLRIKAAAVAIRKNGWSDLKKLKQSQLKDFYLDIKHDKDDLEEAFAMVINQETPLEKVTATKFLKELPNEKSGVMIEKDKIQVHLDNYQLKHQPSGPKFRIGTRMVSGGTLFKEEYASETWHKDNTLAYMLDWADKLGEMTEGQVVQHGQSDNIDGIHYEGSCVFAEETKYVLFHCYPHPKSKYDSGLKK